MTAICHVSGNTCPSLMKFWRVGVGEGRVMDTRVGKWLNREARFSPFSPSRMVYPETHISVPGQLRWDTRAPSLLVMGRFSRAGWLAPGIVVLNCLSMPQP